MLKGTLFLTVLIGLLGAKCAVSGTGAAMARVFHFGDAGVTEELPYAQ